MDNKLLIKQKFLKRFHNEEELRERYGYVAPLIPRYIDAVLDLFPSVSKQFLDKILNVHIRTKVQGTHYDAMSFEAPRINNIARSDTAIILTLPNNSQLNSDSIEYDNDYDVHRRTIDFIHELTHATCHSSSHYEKNRGWGTKSKQVVTELGRSDKMLTYISEQNKYEKQLDFNELLHEGITENIAQKIFAQPQFAEYHKNRKSEIGYEAFVRLVQVVDACYDNLLTNLYFADDEFFEANKENFAKMMQTIDNVYKTMEVYYQMSDKTFEAEPYMIETKTKILTQALAEFPEKIKKDFIELNGANCSEEKKNNFKAKLDKFLDEKMLTRTLITEKFNSQNAKVATQLFSSNYYRAKDKEERKTHNIVL